jgi:uncharacterized protein DUF6011
MDVAELPELTKEQLDEYEVEWIAAAWEGRAKYDAEWRSQGRAVAWIEPVPTHLSASGWDYYAISEPAQACIRIIRFVLRGGGQIRVQEMFCEPEYRILGEKHTMNCPEWTKCYRYGRRLQVKAETPNGIRIAHGRIDGYHYEMSMEAVVFPGQCQDIADRTAATLRLLVGDDGMPLGKETFMALLDGSEGCAFCARALRDPVSKLIGFGPDCAKRYGLAHTNEAANEVLAKRRALGL